MFPSPEALSISYIFHSGAPMSFLTLDNHVKIGEIYSLLLVNVSRLENILSSVPTIVHEAVNNSSDLFLLLICLKYLHA